MSRPNDSFARNADAGGSTLLATHAPGDGKEYPVTIIANHNGHLEGSLDTWMLMIPPQAVGASKIHLDLWNGTASNILKVRGVWVGAATDVANNAAVNIRLDHFRTSAIGTAGTAATASPTTAVPAFTPKDSTNAALPAGVTARAAPTGGATNAAYLMTTFHGTEELQVHANLGQFFNALPNPERGEQELVLNPSQGYTIKQGTVASVGSLTFLVSFTIE